MGLLSMQNAMVMAAPHIESTSGDLATFTTNFPARLNSCVVDIVPVQSGSGDPAPDNVRPITGWAGVNVWDDSKYGGLINWNQLVDNGNFADGTTGWSGSSYVTKSVENSRLKIGTSNSSNRAYSISHSCQITNGHKYYVSFGIKRTIASASYGSASTFSSTMGGSFTLSLNTDTKREYIAAAASDYSTITIEKSVCKPNTGDALFELWDVNVFDLTQMFGDAKADEIYALYTQNAAEGIAYFRSLFPNDYYTYNAGTQTTVDGANGQTVHSVSIAFPTPPGTVYGGTLDLISGRLTLTKKRVLLGDYTWEYVSSSGGYFRTSRLSDAQSLVANEYPDALCEIYPIKTSTNMASFEYAFAFGYGTSAYMYIRDSRYTSGANLKTALQTANAALVYKLKTPISYQLTPQEVNALMGQNNIWADTGAVAIKYWNH